MLQILNRTNNIFELVTVDQLPEQNDVKGKLELLISESDGDEDKNLRLKGLYGEISCVYRLINLS